VAAKHSKILVVDGLFQSGTSPTLRQNKIPAYEKGRALLRMSFQIRLFPQSKLQDVPSVASGNRPKCRTPKSVEARVVVVVVVVCIVLFQF